MCIIAVKPASKEMFKDSVIKQMFLRNRDGAGVMWNENEIVHFKKGFMTARDVLDFIHSRNWDGVPVVLHFRIGTAGPNNKLNCHPYPIWQENRLEGECDLCMAHNGILSQYDPPIGSKINDTQEFVNKALSNLPEGFLESKGIRHLIRKVIRTSRLCFLSKTGKITRFGKWMKTTVTSLVMNRIKLKSTNSRHVRRLKRLRLSCHSGLRHHVYVMGMFIKFANLQII